jgi:glycosyltransferase involved in cell wall biosynthesis
VLPACDPAHTSAAATLARVNATLLPIDAGRRPLEDHRELAGAEALERIRVGARALGGASVLCLTAADAAASHAPHYLRSLLPLMADAGIEVAWRTLTGGAHGKVGEWLEQALGGAEFAASAAEWEAWVEESAAALEPELAHADLVVVHDAAALGCLEAARAGGTRCAWSRHEDAAGVDAAAAGRLKELLEGVEVVDVAPSIDPLGPRSHDLPRNLSGQVLRSLGVDLSRPYVCQTGVIDRWTDPHTAIDAFDALKGTLPELQLVIAGALPGEGAGDMRIAREIDDYAEGRRDVHVKTGYGGVGNVELNALQRVARAGLALSLRIDTGPSRLETWWKSTPVVGSGAGPLAVDDGRDGFSAADAEGVATQIEALVRDPGLAVELGAAGRERVRTAHLITRALEDELRLAGSLLGTVAG